MSPSAPTRYKSVSVSLPTDSAVTRTAVSVSINRKDCPAVFDTIKLPLAANPLQTATQTSTGGHFEATYQLGQLTVAQRP
jgi:hypothetical protein